MKIGYTVAPCARETELNDAHLRAPTSLPPTPPRSPFRDDRPSTRRPGLNTTRVAIAASIALALEALRRVPGAKAQWPGQMFPDPFAGMNAQAAHYIERAINCNALCTMSQYAIDLQCGAASVFGAELGAGGAYIGEAACQQYFALIKSQCAANGCATL
jgi:hypothetical protein